jgi:hypothetical protein
MRRMAELFADLDVLVVPPVGKMLKLKRLYGQESNGKVEVTLAGSLN